MPLVYINLFHQTVLDVNEVFERFYRLFVILNISVQGSWAGVQPIGFLKSGQQIKSKIDSFQNANFLISQPNPMV